VNLDNAKAKDFRYGKLNHEYDDGFESGYVAHDEAAIIEGFCNEVDSKAQEMMVADGKVEGTHYAAMRLVFEQKFGKKWK
jgi:hypothetical protein